MERLRAPFEREGAYQAGEVGEFFRRRLQFGYLLAAGSLQHLPHAHATLCGDSGHAGHRDRADAPGRCIDDAAQRFVVARIDYQPEIGHEVFDFLAVVERMAAVDAVRHVAPPQGVFDGARLGIVAVEYSYFVPPAAVLPALPFGQVGDEVGLFLVRIGLQHLYPVTLVVLRKDVLGYLAVVLGDDAVGGVHDILCRTVVLFQFKHLRLRKVVLESEDVLYLGSAEGVDALRVVAHHADVGVGLCQAAYDEILCVVGILVLIYEDVPEPVPVLFQRVGKVAEKDVGVYQQVVEIHGVVGLAPPGVFEEDGGEFGTLPLPVFGDERGVGRIGLGGHEIVFRQRDAGVDVARLVFVGIEVSLLDDGREQAFAVCRVVYREVGVETESPGLLP